MSSPDVVVIGGGTNGLAAAAYLAKSGRIVLVLEARAVLGGLAASEEFHPGWRTPGVLHSCAGLDAAVVEDLGLARHGLVREGAAPSRYAAERGGPGLHLPPGDEAGAEKIATRSEADARSYSKMHAFLARVRPALREVFAGEPLPLPGDAGGSLLDLVRRGITVRRLPRRDLAELLRLPPMCVADWMREQFETELLGCLLAGPALEGAFLGPWSPGSMATFLRAHAIAGPEVRGGPPALVAALEAAARSFGAEIRTDAPVRTIRTSKGGVAGVTLENGESIDASAVVATCDPKRTFLELLPPRDLSPRLEHRISKFRTTGQSAKVHLALRAPLRYAGSPNADVEWARTGASFDEIERAFDASKYGRISERPMLEIHVPTIRTPGLAPAGGHVVSVLAHWAPRDLRSGWDESARERLGDVVVAALEEVAPGVGGNVEAREILGPADLEKRWGPTGGHVHHGEHGLDQLLVRPVPECAGHATPVPGLFLGGSGSAPGGGITCAPGRLAARAVREA